MTSSAVPALHLDNITVAYGQAPVIRNLSLNVGAGEAFGLIGLNGTGKTTLIKTMLGLRTHQKGLIRMFGQLNTRLSSKAASAYLPERFEPPWFMTGLEFLKLSLNLYGQALVRNEILEKAQTLSLTENILNGFVRNYSKGMRQKLGILSALITSSRILILDEPMGGLDSAARVRVKEMLMEEKAQGRTLFLSSHILSDLEEICDRIGILQAGSIKFTGKTEDLKKATGCTNLERAFLHFIEKKEAA